MRTTLKVKSERAANCSSTERFWKSSACVTVTPTLVWEGGRAGRRMRIEAGLGCCVRLGRRGHLKELQAVAWGGLDHASDQVGGWRQRRRGAVADGLEDLHEEVLDPGGHERHQHPRGALPHILETMRHAPRTPEVVARLGHERDVTDAEFNAAFDDVPRLILALMEGRRGSASRPPHVFD